jgi:MoxR-like ATPase
VAAKGAASSSGASGAVSAARGTAAQLPKSELTYRAPGEVLHDHLTGLMKELQGKGLSRDEALVAMFPKTVLPIETYEDTLAALLSGAHILFFGPSGSGKTNLAKELWDLYPKVAWTIDGCPLLDHPASVLDAAVAEEYPPCPICSRRFSPDGAPESFDPKNVDPSKVPVRRINLREGFGFARIQGSSEVFPDHLTGNINLVKLEQIGDPMSPLVLEPGKLLQANRGVLLVDEIGKLPLGTQNVLLQALQEGTVTPAKSRESFPSRFVAVCTSNLSDLDNINDPLSDRLTSIHVEFNRVHGRNRRIVEMARPPSPTTWVPEVLLDAGVRVIEQWRDLMSDDNPDVGEVGSNRTLIDVGFRMEAFSKLKGHGYPTFEDLRAGLLHAMRGRIRARSGDSFQQNSRLVSEFIDKHLEGSVKRSATVYWCRFFRDRLKANRSDGEGVVSEGRRLTKDSSLISQVALGEPIFPRFQEFSKWVGEREKLPTGVLALDAAIGEFGLLDKFSLFSCEEGADDHDQP